MLTAIGLASIGIETSLSHPDLALAFGNGIRPAACRWQRRSETAALGNGYAVGRSANGKTLEHIACEHAQAWITILALHFYVVPFRPFAIRIMRRGHPHSISTVYRFDPSELLLASKSLLRVAMYRCAVSIQERLVFRSSRKLDIKKLCVGHASEHPRISVLTAIGLASIGIETPLSHPDLALAFGNGIRPSTAIRQRRSETATFGNGDAVGRQSPSETLEHIACEHTQAHRTIIRELDEKNLLQSHVRLVRQDSKRDTCRTLGNSRSKNSLHCDRRALLAIAAALNKRTLRVERANAVNSHHKTVVVAPVFLRDLRNAKAFSLLRPCRIREIVNVNHRRIAPMHIHRSLHQCPASLIKQLQASISIHIDRS